MAETARAGQVSGELINLLQQRLRNEGRLTERDELTPEDFGILGESLHAYSKTAEASALEIEIQSLAAANGFAKRLLEGGTDIIDRNALRLRGYLGVEEPTLNRLVRSGPKSGVKSPSSSGDIRTMQEVAHLFRDELDRLVPQVREFELKTIFPEMNFEKLFDDLGAGDELWWLDTYAPDYYSWIDNLDEAIVRGAKIRMLILDHTCDNAQSWREKSTLVVYLRRRFLRT